MNYDTIIVGGGPAGLSAALLLGRCRRRVLICDSGRYRNAASSGVHGFLTRDGMPPGELLQVARDQLKPYAVELRQGEVRSACQHEGGFKVTFADGAEFSSRKLMLATGVTDRLPDIDGLKPLYGKSVHHCPYCDGWEHADQPIGVYGKQVHGYSLARALKNWSQDIVLVTDGQSGLDARQRTDLKQLDIRVITTKIARLEGEDGRLRRIVFVKGEPLERQALFFSTGQEQCCDLPKAFGCVFSSKGAVETNRRQETNVPGLYVVGDACRDVQFVIVAAAEGAKAAEAINEVLMKEDLAAALQRTAHSSAQSHS